MRKNLRSDSWRFEHLKNVIFVPKSEEIPDTKGVEKVHENGNLVQIVSPKVRSEHAGTKKH